MIEKASHQQLVKQRHKSRSSRHRVLVAEVGVDIDKASKLHCGNMGWRASRLVYCRAERSVRQRRHWNTLPECYHCSITQPKWT